MKDITPHNLLAIYTEMAEYANDPHAPESVRNAASARMYLLGVINSMLNGEVRCELATGFDEIEERGAIFIDGTWWCADQYGTLFALDELDLLWYEVDVVDEDADVTLYYMDIRDQCLGNLVA